MSRNIELGGEKTNTEIWMLGNQASNFANGSRQKERVNSNGSLRIREISNERYGDKGFKTPDFALVSVEKSDHHFTIEDCTTHFRLIL